MKKIPSVWKRDYEGTRLIFDEVVPGSEWVLAGEGVATRKFDGTACMIREGRLFRRFDRKLAPDGTPKAAPDGWEPCEPAPDTNTGHWPGWIPVGIGNEDRWHREAWAWHAGLEGLSDEPLHVEPGNYELIGPKIQGGTEKPTGFHVLVRHGAFPAATQCRSFDGIRSFLEATLIEGIVWHHPDGRMAKIKRKDFGFEWPPRKETCSQK